MRDSLTTLADRSIDPAPLAIRPRTPSRFESDQTADEGVSESQVAVERTGQPAGAASLDAASRSGPTPATYAELSTAPERAEAESPAPEIRIERAEAQSGESTETHRSRDVPAGDPWDAGALNWRFDALNRELQRLGGQSESTPRTKQADATAPTIETHQVTHVHNTDVHENHYQHNTHEHHAASGKPAPDNAGRFVAESPESPPPVVEIPNAAAPTPIRQVDSPRIEPSPVRPAPADPATLPEIRVADERTAAAADQQPLPPPRSMSAPQIVVETPHAESTAAPTNVTVTIGRIELRGPNKPAPPAASQRAKPTARIMDLDEYVRRRAGGRR